MKDGSIDKSYSYKWKWRKYVVQLILMLFIWKWEEISRVGMLSGQFGLLAIIWESFRVVFGVGRKPRISLRSIAPSASRYIFSVRLWREINVRQ